MHVAAPYRSSGADLPFGSLTSRHGVAMEGYFWRFTDAVTTRCATASVKRQKYPSIATPWREVREPKGRSAPLERYGTATCIPGCYAQSMRRHTVPEGENHLMRGAFWRFTDTAFQRVATAPDRGAFRPGPGKATVKP